MKVAVADELCLQDSTKLLDLADHTVVAIKTHLHSFTMEQSVSELKTAAQIMNAPPSMVTSEQRKEAEQLLMVFKRSEQPYNLCQHLLEHTSEEYLHFVACSTIKEAMMREWSLLSVEQIDQMRDYLLTYTNTHTSTSGYVIRQILHVVALIVKRSVLSRDKPFLLSFVERVCYLFQQPNTLELGLEICSALIAEFTVADKSLSSYMSYQHNLDCKRAMESEPMYRMFMCTIQAVETIRVNPVAQCKSQWSKVIVILHSILSWDFSVVLSKRLAQMSNLTLPIINLRPPARWSFLKEPKTLTAFVELHELFAEDPNLRHYSRLCLVQLGTLQGEVFTDQSDRIHYLSLYLQIMTKLLAVSVVKEEHSEDHGLSLAVRQLLWTYTSQDLNSMESALWSSFISNVTDLTCKVLVHSTKYDDCASDTDQDVVDVVLDIWLTLLGQAEDLEESLQQPMSRIVETYIQCHMAPPVGIRDDARDTEEVDLESEEDDRDKFRDQLHIIGLLARHCLSTSLPLLTSLLLPRAIALRAGAENQEESTPLFEDVHWLMLLLGHTLADNWTDATTTIPSNITTLLTNDDTNFDSAALCQHVVSKIGRCEEFPLPNPVLKSIFALFELAAVYQDLLQQGACHSLSAQVYSSLTWVLARVTASYLMPSEHKYTFIPRSLLLAFGEEGETGKWLVGFLVEKVISGLVFYPGDMQCSEDCVLLVQSMSKNPHVAPLLMKDGNFMKLVEQFTGGTLVLGSSKGCRTFAAAMVTIMSHLNLDQHQAFIDKVFHGVREQLLSILSQAKDIPTNANMVLVLMRGLDTFHGVATGLITKVVDLVFPLVVPVLEGCVPLLKYCQHLTPVIRSVLELFCCVADNVILHLSKEQTHRLYEACYSLLKAYSDNTTKTKIASTVNSEEDKYDNMLLCLELLSHLCSKDFLSFDEKEDFDDSTSKIVLIGLDILVPHIDLELLKYPKLCFEFFKLVTFICEVYPEKVAGLQPTVVDQILTMLKMGLNNYNDDITFYIFNAVSALSVYSESHRDFQKKLGELIKYTLVLISSQQLHAELYDPAAEMIFSFICKCREEYLVIVQEIVLLQTDPKLRLCLERAFSALIPTSLTLSRKDKVQFTKIFENFAINVYGICR